MKNIFALNLIGMFFIVISFASPTLGADDTTPLMTLKRPVDTIISILKDPKYDNGKNKEEQREKIWKQVPEIFDFEDMGQRSLGRYVRLFDKEQKKEFVSLFTKLIGVTYMDKIQAEYDGEAVVFKGEDFITKEKVVVSTVIPRENIEIPINYSMKKENGKWRVYDVNIEGVSLVKNYRSQFASMLRKGNPDDFLKKLREKTDG